MIDLTMIKTCADYSDSIQAEGFINLEMVPFLGMENLLKSLQFSVFFLGEPQILIGRRPDCSIILHQTGLVSLSEVCSEEKLSSIIQEIELHAKKSVCTSI